MHHLFAAISGHGFGHLVQVSPLINTLRRRHPQLTLTVQSPLPIAILTSRIDGTFQHINQAADFGMVMHNPLDIDVEASYHSYRDFHNQWQYKLAQQVALLEQQTPDLLLADIPYLPLAAATKCGIPNVAMCSLNWADIFAGYCLDRPDGPRIYQQILHTYQAVDLFLRPMPSMPMPDIKTTEIGPLIPIGRNRRKEINQRLEINPEDRLVLVTLGGVDHELSITQWEKHPGIHWIVPDNWNAAGRNISNLSATKMPFDDLFASCDALVTKPGYGAFTGAACHALPMLYAERGDWPEEPALTAWIKTHARSLEIPREQLWAGDLIDPLQQLWNMPAMPPVKATGAEEGADFIERLLAAPR